MNKDQANGTLKNIAGKVQQTLGEITDNKQQQVDGLNKQLNGNVQSALGDAKDAIKRVQKAAKKTFRV